ncbi:MAG: hypothetical protein H0X30_09730 [Anaerolineae bacterium]|nr:hypothetical protein [Anaerolineae bacterium]
MIAELEARERAERVEWAKLALLKWESEKAEREARYIKYAEEAAAQHLAVQEARKHIIEKPLTVLEIQEKADRELWKAEIARRRREMGQNVETNFTKTGYEPAYDKESWKARLAEQDASAEAWEKQKLEQANASKNNDQSEESSE